MKAEILNRTDWNKEYSKIIMKRAALIKTTADYLASVADDSFNDRETPSDAVELELSCWERF